MDDSESSTPANKKIKVSTWASILNSIPKEDLGTGLDVTKLLDGRVDATAFLGLGTAHKKMILDDVLPGQEDLVGKILLHADHNQPITLREKIMRYLLSPSKVTSSQVVAVANIIFDANLGDLNEFKSGCQVEYKCDNLYTPTVDLKHLIGFVLEEFNFFVKISVNVTIEEDAGYLPLGGLISRFAQALSDEHHVDIRYYAQRSVCDNKGRGNPSTDGALVHRLISVSRPSYISKVIYEYKPSVHPDIDHANTQHLIELFLQCFYVMRSEDTGEVIGCLTDLRTWHYFKFTLNNDRKSDISWYHLVKLSRANHDTTSKELVSHLSFLMHHLKPVEEPRAESS